MPAETQFEELRNPEALKGISQLGMKVVVDAPGYGSELIREAEARFKRLMEDMFKLASIALVDDDAKPRLLVSVMLRNWRECTSGFYFHVFRVETVLREPVSLVRDPKRTTLADVWRHRIAVGYVPQNYDGRALEAQLMVTTSEQSRAFLADLAQAKSDAVAPV